MNKSPHGKEVVEEERETPLSPSSDHRSVRVGFDSEALESFAEVLGILREWEEADDRKSTDEEASTDAPSC